MKWRKLLIAAATVLAVGIATPGAAMAATSGNTLVHPAPTTSPTITIPGITGEFFAPGPNTIVRLSNGPKAASTAGIASVTLLCGLNELQEVSGQGPITLSLTVTRSLEVQYSLNAGYSAEVLSAQVGFSVTSSYGIEDSGTYSVPSGKFGVLRAFPLYDRYTVAAGTAMLPIGVCFDPYLE